MGWRKFVVVLATGSTFQQVEVEAESVTVTANGATDRICEVKFINPRGYCAFSGPHVVAVYEVSS